MKSNTTLEMEFRDWIKWDRLPPDEEDPDYYTYSWGLKVWIAAYKEYTAPPTRIEKARPHLQMMAQLVYIMEQPEPKDYLLLTTIKYIKHIATYAKAEVIRHMLSMPEKEFAKRVDRMRDKGWVAMEGEYINISGAGDNELSKIMGWISYALGNLKERKPIEEWTELTRK